MMKPTKTTVTVFTDPVQKETVVRLSGCKCPISYIQVSTSNSLASAYRDAAAYFLDLAGNLPNQVDSLQAQTATMLQEHRSIFA